MRQHNLCDSFTLPATAYSPTVMRDCIDYYMHYVSI